jgi:O-antigen ligase
MIAAAFQRVQIEGPAWLAVPIFGLMLGASAVIAPDLALGVVVGGIFVALAMYDLAAGVAAFILLSFFERLPGLPASQLSAIKAAGVILVLAWLAHLAANRGSMPFLPSAYPIIAYAAGALVVLAFASLLWSSDADVARSYALRLAQGPVLLAIVFSAIRRPEHFRWALWAYFAGAVGTAIVGIGKTAPDANDIGRFSGGIRDPNELAAALLPAIPIAVFALAAVRKPMARWILGAGLLLISVTILMTGSRGGLVGLGVMFILAIVLSGPLRQQVVFGVMIVTGVAVAYYTLFAPPVVLWRLTHFTSGGGSGREDLWSIAMAMVRDHPLFGVGAGNFQVLEPTYALSSINIGTPGIIDSPRWVHNTYLHVLVELGVVGLICLLVIVAGTLIAGVRSFERFVQSGDVQSEILARGFIIGVVGMLAAYTFITAQYEKQLWLLLGVTLGLQTVSRAPDAIHERSLHSVPSLKGSLSFPPSR